jgi:hypothetical protein
MLELKQAPELTKYLIEQLRINLEKQKHNTTGKLSDSVNVVVSKPNEITAEALIYGGAVDRGRKKGENKVPIAALEEWARNKNLSLDEGQTYKSVAFAIQAAIYKKGIPSKAYVRWSIGNSLNRLQWATRVLTEKNKEITTIITKMFTAQIEINMKELLEIKRPDAPI